MTHFRPLPTDMFVLTLQSTGTRASSSVAQPKSTSRDCSSSAARSARLPSWEFLSVGAGMVLIGSIVGAVIVLFLSPYFPFLCFECLGRHRLALAITYLIVKLPISSLFFFWSGSM